MHAVSSFQDIMHTLQPLVQALLYVGYSDCTLRTHPSWFHDASETLCTGG
jgi:hypothetical protein